LHESEEKTPQRRFADWWLWDRSGHWTASPLLRSVANRMDHAPLSGHFGLENVLRFAGPSIE
jgi:hypothetical protein